MLSTILKDSSILLVRYLRMNEQLKQAVSQGTLEASMTCYKGGCEQV